MKQALVTLGFLVCWAAPVQAENVEGYLIDEMCSAKVVKAGGDAAKAHTKDCALMPDCKSSGFGIVTADGRFFKFDDDGDRMAAKMIGFASGKDDIKATVNGEVKGDTIAVRAVQLL